MKCYSYIFSLFIETEKQETQNHLSTSQATPQVKQTFEEAKIR